MWLPPIGGRWSFVRRLDAPAGPAPGENGHPEQRVRRGADELAHVVGHVGLVVVAVLDGGTRPALAAAVEKEPLHPGDPHEPFRAVACGGQHSAAKLACAVAAVPGDVADVPRGPDGSYERVRRRGVQRQPLERPEPRQDVADREPQVDELGRRNAAQRRKAARVEADAARDARPPGGARCRRSRTIPRRRRGSCPCTRRAGSADRNRRRSRSASRRPPRVRAAAAAGVPRTERPAHRGRRRAVPARPDSYRSAGVWAPVRGNVRLCQPSRHRPRPPTWA